MDTKLNIKKGKEELFQKLKIKGWDDFFKSFLLSSDFDKIIEKLYEEYEDEKRFQPSILETFKPYLNTRYTTIHTIVISDEPVCKQGFGLGIPYTYPQRLYAPLSTTLLLEEIDDSIRNEKFIVNESTNTRIENWGNNGILSIYATPTVRIDYPRSHTEIWKPFTAFLLDSLSLKKDNLNFVIISDEPQKTAVYIDPSKHSVYILSNIKKNKENKWDSEGVFKTIEKKMLLEHNKNITW